MLKQFKVAEQTQEAFNIDVTIDKDNVLFSYGNHQEVTIKTSHPNVFGECLRLLDEMGVPTLRQRGQIAEYVTNQIEKL